MKVLIEEDVYIGSPAEIMEQLREGSFDRSVFADPDRYISHMCSAFERLTDLPCEVKGDTTDERARQLIMRLADIDALEVLEDE